MCHIWSIAVNGITMSYMIDVGYSSSNILLFLQVNSNNFYWGLLVKIEAYFVKRIARVSI